MDYNFWDDRTHELEENEHPCKGCLFYEDDECRVNGACGISKKIFVIDYDKFKDVLKDYLSDRLIEEMIDNMNDNDVFIAEMN